MRISGPRSRAGLLAVYIFLLLLSIAGSYYASQIDAPYGWDAAMESMRHAAAGWLMLLPLVLVYSCTSRRRAAIFLGLLFLLLGIYIAYLSYDSYKVLYEPYASSLMSRVEYIVMAPLMFILGVLMGIFALPILLLEGLT